MQGNAVLVGTVPYLSSFPHSSGAPPGLLDFRDFTAILSGKVVMGAIKIKGSYDVHMVLKVTIFGLQ